MPAPDELGKLISNFDNHIDELKSNDYKEMSLCTDYLNPLFKLLGWDVDNSVGKAEKFRDVIQQYRLTIGGSSKAPDYLFKIGNTGVFFVEAKKPSVDIAKAKDPAFQLRRYGWNKKEIDVSILTDFETFSVYDCRLKPNADDDPRVGRMAMYTYKDFATKWDELYSLFARENVEKGSLDKLLKEGTVKGIKESVDETFLKMIEEWRDILARNIALRNENLDVRGLNFAVQQTIDRIIFLRIAEDRGLEVPNQLQALTNYGNIYDGLKKLYESADSRYNSGLFHFKSEKDIDTQPDKISMSLSIDDKVLKDMITNLYYPKSPFDFSAMPADILGQVYERFLGKVIRLTDGHHAKVEEKPEVRKAGGVYYTPKYIVDYIVQNTVGKLVEGKTPEQVAKLKILDPACGSGSFLIGAYQYLLDWHLEWYLANDRDKWIKAKNPPICEQMSEGQRIFRLTTEKRKEILKNNIYGVDIDRQAVEVAKLNLLLKVLEQENNSDLFKHNQRALPDLGSNIKCGNSLIGMDFYNSKEDLFNNPEETWRINAMDWDVAFPAIVRFKDKEQRELVEGFGFDAVIGNPPYGLIFDIEEKKYLEDKYPTFIRNNDKYVSFVERSIKLANKSFIFSFIIPNTYIQGPYFLSFRKFLSSYYRVKMIVDFGTLKIFDKPNVFCSILVCDNKSINTNYIKLDCLSKLTNNDIYICLNDHDILNLKWTPSNSLLDKLSLKKKFSDVALVKDVGLNYWSIGREKTRGNSIADRVMYKGEIKNINDTPFLKGRDISRYSLCFSNNYLDHDYELKLEKNVDILRYSPDILLQKKLIYRQTSDHLEATYDNTGYITDKTIHTIIPLNKSYTILYFLGVFNSKLLNYYYSTITGENNRTFAQVKIFRVKELPFAELNFSNKSDVEKHDKMVALVETMLELNKRLRECSIPSDTEMIKRQIEHTDRQIDQLVYELYGLTDDDIRIVEDSFTDCKKK